MKDIYIDYEELKKTGRKLNKLSDDYYDLRADMRRVLNYIEENASDFYAEGYEIYTDMLSSSDLLNSLGNGAITIADSYEETDNELMRQAELLGQQIDFDPASDGSGSDINVGSNYSFYGKADLISAEEIVPSAIISDNYQHEGWLIELYARKALQGGEEDEL